MFNFLLLSYFMKILTLLNIFSRSSMRSLLVTNSQKLKKVALVLLLGVKIQLGITHENFMIIWRHDMLLFKIHVSPLV
jgi:hypothetical protein